MPPTFSAEFPRLIAKAKDSKRPKVFSVYDRQRASYPVLVPGFGRVRSEGTQQEMTAEAQRLAEFYSNQPDKP